MTHIKYQLEVKMGSKMVYSIDDAGSLPRLQVGDYIGLRPLDVMYDHSARAVVTDALYDLTGVGEQSVIRLYLHIREETDAEQAERQSRVR